jgi:predicted ferric reductase
VGAPSVYGVQRGGHRQVRIASGIGVTPFVGWIGSLDDDFERDIAATLHRRSV